MKPNASLWIVDYPMGMQLDILTDLACMAARHAGRIGAEMGHLLRQRRYKEVLEREWIDYHAITEVKPKDIGELQYARQALAFLQKWEQLDLGIDKRQAAIDSYMLYENECKLTNELFQSRAEGRFNFCARNEWILGRVQRHLTRVLGEVPQLDQLKLRFGPGSTSLIRKREASTLRKLGSELDCSEDLYGVVPKLLQEMPNLAAYHADRLYLEGANAPDGQSEWLRVGEGVRTLSVDNDGGILAEVPIRVTCGALDFVRKNFRTFRTTEKQPILNGMLQNAIGDHLAAGPCMRAGIEIRNQQRNQILAREGSLTGALATLDLRGASDTKSYWLVLETIPIDWFCLLAEARVGRIKDPRTPGKESFLDLEKFSAMGNGFTFPLESLIFWAITQASLDYHKVVLKESVEDERISVYGDDIICPTEIVPIVADALNAFGFTLNKSKSYWSGFFRESCGADFVSGTDIRPIYAKDSVSPAMLFTLHNGLRSKAMHELAAYVERRIPQELRLYGPAGYGDGVLHSEAWPRTRTSEHLALGYEGSVFKAFKRVTKRDRRPGQRPGEPLLPSYTISQRATEDIVKVDTLLNGAFTTLRRLRQPRPNEKGELVYSKIDLLTPFRVEVPSEPIPDMWALKDDKMFVDEQTGERTRVKAPTFPGTDGVKIVSHYILDGEN